MTTTNAVEVLDHNDGIADVITSLLRDCTLAGLRPTHLALSAYAADYFHISVQFHDVESADRAADTWALRPDGGEGTNYTRSGTVDINGRTITVHAYTGRPTLPTYPAGYAPQAVSA